MFVGNVEDCAVGSDRSNADIAGPKSALSQAAQASGCLGRPAPPPGRSRLGQFLVERLV